MGAAYLYAKYRKVKRKMWKGPVKTNPRILTEILRVSLPISIGATVGTIMSLIDFNIGAPEAFIIRIKF